MLPVIAIVGRPNVGKSTLFNRLTASRAALVAPVSGLTRDRQYRQGMLGEQECLIIDTGGFIPEAIGIDNLIQQQTEQALREADVIFFVVDASIGVHPDDIVFAELLRCQSKPCYLLANKCDNATAQYAISEFYTLGLGAPTAIAAEHGSGVRALGTALQPLLATFVSETTTPHSDAVHIAIIGRPNVGKSTLVNRLLGEDRMIVYDEPGTTRDSIFVPLHYKNKSYVLIDTAGVRRHYKSGVPVEYFSVTKALQAIDLAQVVIMVIDARANIVEQDLRLLGFILEAGRALVLAINKWDGLLADEKARVRSELERRLPFLNFAEPHMISALHGTGVGVLFKSIDKAYACAMRDMGTGQLNRILAQALLAHQPPLVHGRRIKLRYAHAGGHNPPTVIIHGNQTDNLPQAYIRYLESTFSKALRLSGTPLRVELRNSENPYAGRVNKLSDRQIQKRRRLMRFVKKRK